MSQPYRVDVQVHFWEGTKRLAFDRAECWTKEGGYQGEKEFGSCVFSVLADVEPLPEPSGALGVLLIALAALCRRRRPR